MDSIAIAAHTDRTDVALALRKLLPDASIAMLRDRLASGEPFIDLLLYGADHDERAALLRSVVAQLQALGVEPMIYEVDAGGEVDPSNRLTPEQMENGFKRWDEIGEEFDELEKKGHKP